MLVCVVTDKTRHLTPICCPSTVCYQKRLHTGCSWKRGYLQKRILSFLHPLSDGIPFMDPSDPERWIRTRVVCRNSTPHPAMSPAGAPSFYCLTLFSPENSNSHHGEAICDGNSFTQDSVRTTAKTTSCIRYICGICGARAKTGHLSNHHHNQKKSTTSKHLSITCLIHPNPS